MSAKSRRGSFHKNGEVHSRRLDTCKVWRGRRVGLEHLEERTLLSMASGADYNQVDPQWFAEFAAPSSLSLAETMALNSQVAPAYGPQEARPEPSRWIVRLTPEAVEGIGSPAQTSDYLAWSGISFQVLRGLGLPGQVLVQTVQSAAAVEGSLRANPYVASFEADGPISVQAFPNDPEFSRQWGLYNTGQTGGTADADIDAPEAWAITTGSPEVVVAVLDTGIDYTHPDLAANVWTNPGEVPGDGVDNDNNGKIDDVHGYDFYNRDGDPMDDHRHGTHVAGTIAAAGNNGAGVTGVSWSTRLMPLKILGEDNRGRDGEGWKADAIEALNYLIMMRQRGVQVRVANNSWGYLGSSSPELRARIQAVGEAGILFVAAAGNGDALGRGIDSDEDPDYAFYPASEDLDNIISVTASDYNDQLARFSNYGLTSVDIAAPGAGILSTEPGGLYQSRYGTSMAAPHVSGVAALVWANVPNATVAEVRDAIRYGADPISAFQDKLAWGGRLNAYGALTVDTVAPHAKLDNAAHVTGPGATEVLITVTHSDNRLIEIDSLDPLDLVVTRLWDGHEMENLTVVSKPASNAANATVVYRVPAPNGTWGAMDDGDYQIWLRAGQVWDTSGNRAGAGFLGSFNVDTTPGLIRVNSTADAADANPGDGIADDGSGHSTLRAAIMQANALAGGNTVRVPPGIYRLSIAGTDDDAASGDLDIAGNLTLRGAGADKTVINAAGLDRVFHVLPGVKVTLSGVTITGGSADRGGGVLNSGALSLVDVSCSGNTAAGGSGGGGVFNETAAALTMVRSTVAANSSDQSGGGMRNEGAATAANSTFSGNRATGAAASGGGVFSGSTSTLTLLSTTIADNSAGAGGGGLFASGTVVANNTIIAANTAASDPDVQGAVGSQGHNLVGDVGGSSGWSPSDVLNVDPLLGPLQDNGGSTWTHALLAGSPAIDAGDVERVLEQTFSSTDVPKPTADQTLTSSTLEVSGAGDAILDLDVVLGIDHTYVGDLEVYLTSPRGRQVELFRNVGGDGDDFTNTRLDDEADTPLAASSAPFTGSFRPQGLLSAFDGEDPTGAWTLSVYDQLSIRDVQTIPAADVPRQILDYATSASYLNVSGISGAILDINVTLDLTHTWDSDLDVRLTSPSGTQVELFTDVGSFGRNFTNTTLDDEALTAITAGVAPFSASFRPEGSLAAFDGEDPTGTWKLEIYDDAAGDVGTLNSWALSITTPGATVQTGAINNWSLVLASRPTDSIRQVFAASDVPRPTVQVPPDASPE
ncbi:MAG: S8 family serine peptidase, partial [Pirellulales bacterium]|nr:S8 family serine peptidase [Pirellulales bacterium]